MSSSSDAILSFDLSKKCTAWAYLVDDELVDYWHFSFRPQDRTSDLFLRMQHYIRSVTAELDENDLRVDRVAYEYAAFQKGHALEQFHALSMAVKVWAHEAGYPCYKVPSANIKRVITGKGNAKKPEMIAGVNALYDLGLDPEELTPNSDIADAIATGLALRQSILDNTHKARLAP